MNDDKWGGMEWEWGMFISKETRPVGKWARARAKEGRHGGELIPRMPIRHCSACAGAMVKTHCHCHHQNEVKLACMDNITLTLPTYMAFIILSLIVG